jgi:hypothetical protein
MISFDEKYGEIHRKLIIDKETIRKLYTAAGKNKEIDVRAYFIRADSELLRTNEDLDYFSCTEWAGIFLGLDLDQVHGETFEGMVASMRLVYEETDGAADLPQVYALLDRRFGIVCEDMSRSGEYTVKGYCEDYLPVLDKIFRKHPFRTQKITFTVLNEEKVIRRPLVNFNRVEVAARYNKRYDRYSRQYGTDERFRIHEPSARVF